MSEFSGIRGRVWFKALTGQESSIKGDPNSILTSDALVGGEKARFLCVVPNPDGRFPCARRGEVGLEEAYTLAARVREVICADKDGPTSLPFEALAKEGSTPRGGWHKTSHCCDRRCEKPSLRQAGGNRGHSSGGRCCGRRIRDRTSRWSPRRGAHRWARDLRWIPHPWLPS